MATKFVSVIPKMTSNTLPSPFVASASTQYSTEYQAWRAFNGESDDSQDSWIATVSTGWLQIKLDESKVVVMYDVVNVNSSGEAQKNAPKSWVLEGSVNGSSWVSLDKRTNEISWQAGEQRSFTFANGNSYLYYRINVTANNGRSYLGIAELVLYEEVEIITTDKILLSSGDGEIKSLKSAVPLDTSSIPVMTSNTAPNGIASASSQASTSYAPWNAFDKNVSSFWSSNADINPYLQYEFKEPVRIGAYALYSGNDTYKPKAWTFEGSNDGATWTVLDIQKSGYTINTLTRYTLSKWGMFKKYRLNFISASMAVYISEFEMYEILETLLYNLPSTTENNFINYGINPLSSLVFEEIGKTKNIVESLSVVGSGKTFEHTIDMSKRKINKIVLS